MATYHEAELTVLVQRVGTAMDGFRDGEFDAFDVDQVVFQYSRAAKELWKFCNPGDAELAADADGLLGVPPEELGGVGDLADRGGRAQERNRPRPLTHPSSGV